MKIEEYEQLRKLRRVTIAVWICVIALVIAFVALAYWTFTGFGQTTLAQGIADCADWVRGVR